MGIGEELQPATEMFSGGLTNILSYAWVLIPVVLIAIVGIGAFLYNTYKKKNSQWTHTLKVRRVLQNGLLTEPIIHRMRRFPLVKKAEVFELEKPLLGSYLLPELDEYSGQNQFSIILDKNNRIYTNQGEFFKPDDNKVHVSAKHSEIDIQRQELKSKYQNIHKTRKRVEWSTIAKYGMMSIAIIAVTIIAIVGIQKWAESQEQQAAQSQAQAKAMQELNKALEHIESSQNTNILIIEKLKDLYGTENIQGEIQRAKNEET